MPAQWKRFIQCVQFGEGEAATRDAPTASGPGRFGVCVGVV